MTKEKSRAFALLANAIDLDMNVPSAESPAEPGVSSSRTSTIKTLVLGQVLSLLLCGTAVSSTGLNVWYGISAPCFQSFLCYLLLASTFGTWFVRSPDFMSTLKSHGWKYLILGILDFEANYLIIRAYNYTTLTSVQLCDAFAIPVVVVLSLVFLRMRFHAIHYVGVVLCILGNICLVLTDGNSGDANVPHPVIGDLLALSGALLYGVCNTAQEYLVKHRSISEYLAMLSLVAVLVSGIQTVIVERDVLITVKSSWGAGALLASFAVAQFFFYVILSVVMRRSNATLSNLSMLTADFLTLLIGLVLFHYKFTYFYFLAFAGVVFGLALYNSRPVPHRGQPEAKSQLVADVQNDEDSTQPIIDGV